MLEIVMRTREGNERQEEGREKWEGDRDLGNG
jgi:hypothetical protein